MQAETFIMMQKMFWNWQFPNILPFLKYFFFFERYQVTLTMILSNDKLYLYFFMIN